MHTSAGLRGISAGQTSLCTVGKEGTGLSYRGYDILDLAEYATFEEVAYLILHGELPTRSELTAFIDKLMVLRGLPNPLKEVLERIPAETHPMDVMRTGCSMLGTLEPELNFDQQLETATRLLAVLPSIMCYWYRFVTDGVRIDTETDDKSIAGHLLHALSGNKPGDLNQRAMDVSLILYAEHELNASTFAARVCAATLSDFHSAVTAAIGTLRGALHGGANEAAMDLIQQYESPEQAVRGVTHKLVSKEKIMGFGHAIYQVSDPRNVVIKAWSKKLSDEIGDTRLFAISEAIEELMWEQKKLFPNLDFFSASAFHFLGVPTQLFTPIFVCSRVSGWSGHIMEQRANNTLIRPTADYIGSADRPFPPIDRRS